ncbi:MAG: NAD(P)-dependent oxidoreductase [Gemmatimonadaceae bacterium]
MHGEHIEAVVVGGGDVGRRKAFSLLEVGARVTVIAIEPCVALTDASDPGLTLIQRAYGGVDDLRDANLVIAATDDHSLNETVAADARRLHRLVNIASAPEASSFSSMAVHRAEPLTVGVSAGGVPDAAVRIRDEIARRFDGRYAAALQRLLELRARSLSGDRSEWERVRETVVSGEFFREVEATPADVTESAQGLESPDGRDSHDDRELS